jgi:putative membrane protein insertion efficiency factor
MLPSGKTGMELCRAQRIFGPIKEIALLALMGYKRFVSPWLPRACRFEPTCSVYMYQAIQKKGILAGIYLGVKRILKCHPFSAGGIDPVP